MACAKRMVVPKRVQESRKRPLFVKYGPIIMSAWMPRSVGLCRKEARRRACIAAATIPSVSLIHVVIS